MIEPQVVIKLIDLKGKEFRIQGKAKKMQKRTNSSLMKKAKLGRFKKLSINVDYGKDIENSMECQNYFDLKWALEAFLEKNLWIK